MEHFLHFIVNKQSRNSQAVFKKLVLELPKYKINYGFLVTENVEQLDRLLSQLKKTINPNDIFVVVGGDGSLNHFVTFYTKYQFKNAIGYIPAGSGNDFARAHQIPIDTKKALLHLFSIEEKQNLSIILASQGEIKHLAVNSMGFGIDGMIGHMMSSGRNKEKLGAKSYFLGVFSGFIKQKKFPLTLIIDDGEYQFNNVQLALVANNPSFAGGIFIVPEANGKDDQLEILIADDVSAGNLASILAKLVTNKTHLTHPKLHSFKSRKVRIIIDSAQYAQKDGEVFAQKKFDYSFDTKALPFWI